MTRPRVSHRQVSVVVCTRNRSDLLRRCLGRLAELDPKPLEIVVVDQSDGNESGVLARGWMAGDPSRRWIPTATRGASRARNLGIREAEGEIVALTDDDCLVRRDWVGAVVRTFNLHPEIAAVTGGSQPEGSEEADPRALAAATWHPENPRVFQSPVDPSLVGASFNLSFRKSWAEKVGGFDPDLGPGGRFRGAEDTDFIHRILHSGGTIRYEPEVVVTHLPWRDPGTQSMVDREYGHGIAAWALRRLTQGDLFPAKVALMVVLSQGRRALGGILRRDESAWRTGKAYLSGLGTGLLSWLLASASPRSREDRPREVKSSA